MGGVEEDGLAKWHIQIPQKYTFSLELTAEKVPLQKCPHITGTGGHAKKYYLVWQR